MRRSGLPADPLAWSAEETPAEDRIPQRRTPETPSPSSRPQPTATQLRRSHMRELTTRPAVPGRELSFEQVYTEWFHEVRRWARAFGGPSADCEDVAQEVFLVVRRQLPRFDGKNLPGWLYGITRRTVRDFRRAAWFRRFWKNRMSFDQEAPHFRDNVAISDLRTKMEQRDAWRELERILDRMSDKQRAVFVLFEVEGYSGPEIAELEGVKLATLWSRLHQARAAFAAAVAQERARRPEAP